MSERRSHRRRRVVVRSLAASDFGEWLPLGDGHNEFYGRKEPTALPPAVTRATRRDPGVALRCE